MHCSYSTPNIATMNILLYLIQKYTKLKCSNACASIVHMHWSTASAVLPTLKGFVSTNQLTLSNSKKIDIFPVLWEKQRKKMSQEKESLTHYIQSSWWSKNSTSCRKILPKRKEKGRNPVLASQRGSHLKVLKRPSLDESGSASWGKTRAQVVRASQQYSTSYSQDLSKKGFFDRLQAWAATESGAASVYQAKHE